MLEALFVLILSLLSPVSIDNARGVEPTSIHGQVLVSPSPEWTAERGGSADPNA